ncbi:hypothetical protein JW756_06830 [Candidatus Woesearchaeota archaeon]|nr:hypothetical protein [Candidatus Woesearchaeota archaeon]
MDLPVAEVCRPLKRGMISLGLYGIMHDYVRLLADAKYSEKKEELRSQVNEQRRPFNFFKYSKVLKQEKPRIRGECLADAARQIDFVLKKYSIGVDKKIEYDELVIDDERLDEAPRLLEELVADMNELLLKNSVASPFRINSYFDYFLKKPGTTLPEDAYIKLKKAKERQVKTSVGNLGKSS